MNLPAPSPAAFVGDPSDTLDQVLTVETSTGRVHRGPCPAAPHLGGFARWSAAVGGEQDQPCRTCMPEGLPR